jgi:hypothetical protein
MSDHLETQTQSEIIEQVVINGDLSRLTPEQRVGYYKSVCQSIGLNPLTKPFDYINLNGKLTLYARKDATDQLRKLNDVSIDDVSIDENSSQFIVKVKGHDKSGRCDVEIGVVNKSDMRGDTANSMMKAVTKAKRRLTLSICGLGWLDETEVETIPAPAARPAAVNADTGEIAPQSPAPLRQSSPEPWALADRLVAEGIVESDFHARAVLKALNCSGLTDDQAVQRVRLYRGWRDLGKDKEESKRLALAGEVPA